MSDSESDLCRTRCRNRLWIQGRTRSRDEIGVGGGLTYRLGVKLESESYSSTDAYSDSATDLESNSNPESSKDSDSEADAATGKALD